MMHLSPEDPPTEDIHKSIARTNDASLTHKILHVLGLFFRFPLAKPPFLRLAWFCPQKDRKKGRQRDNGEKEATINLL